MATHRGFDVLELDPDRGSGRAEEVERKVFILDSVMGIHGGEAADPAAQVVREFLWMAFTRAEAKALRDFVDVRKGRAVPFWVASWDEDVKLNADHVAGLTLTVLAVGYTAQMFAVGSARRHLAIRLPGGTTYYRKVAGSVDNGDGTETLTLEETVPVPMPEATLVSILHFVRLDNDAVEIEWSGGFSQAQMKMRDLPTETPA